MFVVFLMTSCKEGSSDIDYNPDEKKVEVILDGEDLEFTRLSNGTIPGGEVTQMYAQSDDYKSKLSIRWSRKDDGSYDFDNPPSITLDIKKEDGDDLSYRAKDGEDVSKYFEEDRVYKVVGEIKMNSSNKAAREAKPDGATLKVELQKKKPK